MGDEWEDDEVESDFAPQVRAGFTRASVAFNAIAFGRDLCTAVDNLLARLMIDAVAADAKDEFASSVRAGIESL